MSNVYTLYTDSMAHYIRDWCHQMKIISPFSVMKIRKFMDMLIKCISMGIWLVENLWNDCIH